MKFRIFAVVAMMALLGMLARGPVSVMAQDASASPPAGQPQFDVSKLDGIEHGVSRAYIGDMSAIMKLAGTPSADGKAPDMSSLGLFALGGTIVSFKDDGKAKDAFQTIASEAKTSLAQGSTAQMTEEKVDGLGDNTKAYSMTTSDSGMNTSMFFVLTQDGSYIYVAFGVSFTPDVNALKDATVNFTKALVDGKAGSGDGTINKDGTSTGGLWDKFPAAGNDVLKGLKPSADTQVYPVPAS